MERKAEMEEARKVRESTTRRKEGTVERGQEKGWPECKNAGDKNQGLISILWSCLSSRLIHFLVRSTRRVAADDEYSP